MKIPKIKQPLTVYSAFPLPLSNVDGLWFNKNGKPKEIEALVDGVKSIIEIHEMKHIDFDWLDLLSFQIKQSFGIEVDVFKKILVKKYSNLIEKQEVALILYKFIEVI